MKLCTKFECNRAIRFGVTAINQSITINKFISRHSTEAHATARLCRIKEKCLKTDLKCVNGWSSSTVQWKCNFNIWPNDLERCVTCCARLGDNFRQVWPSTYSFFMLIPYVMLWPWPLARSPWKFVVHQASRTWSKSVRNLSEIEQARLNYWCFCVLHTLGLCRAVTSLISYAVRRVSNKRRGSDLLIYCTNGVYQRPGVY